MDTHRQKIMITKQTKFMMYLDTDISKMGEIKQPVEVPISFYFITQL